MLKKTQKQIFGFDKGYIWIIKDSRTKTEDEVLSKSNARFCTRWGWYFFDNPNELPEEYEYEKLPWSKVGNEDGSLKTDILINPEFSPVGKIKDRIEIDIEVCAATDEKSRFGQTRTHIMTDAAGNTYLWKTAAKSWDVGTKHHIRGTIKDYDGTTCILTRCMEK